MRNAKASLAVVLGLVSVGILVVAGTRTRLDGLSNLAYGAIPVSLLAAILSLSFSRRARFDYQRTLGRAGGGSFATVGKAIGLLGLLLALTAALAVVVGFALRTLR